MFFRIILEKKRKWHHRDGGPVSRLRQAARCLTLDSVLTIWTDTSRKSYAAAAITCTRTAPHLTAADTRRRQDDRPQDCVISAGLDRCAAGRGAQKSLVKTVCQAPRLASATELGRYLHWLSVRRRISYKVAVITYKTRSTSKLAYRSTTARHVSTVTGHLSQSPQNSSLQALLSMTSPFSSSRAREVTCHFGHVNRFYYLLTYLLTSLTSCKSSKTTDQPEHYDHRTNCYCLYRGWR